MNLIAILVGLTKNPNVNQKLLDFTNQTLDLILPPNYSSLDDVRALRNQTITLVLEDVQQHYTLNFIEQPTDKILITSGKVDHPSLVVTTSSQALQQLVDKTVDLDGLTKSNRLSFTGNSQLLVNLLNLSVKIDYSAENILSKYLGDVPGYFLSKAGSQALDVAKAFTNWFANLVPDSATPGYTTDLDAFRDDSKTPSTRQEYQAYTQQTQAQQEQDKSLEIHAFTALSKAGTKVAQPRVNYRQYQQNLAVSKIERIFANVKPESTNSGSSAQQAEQNKQLDPNQAFSFTKESTTEQDLSSSKQVNNQFEPLTQLTQVVEKVAPRVAQAGEFLTKIDPQQVQKTLTTAAKAVNSLASLLGEFGKKSK